MVDTFVPRFILRQYEQGRTTGEFLAATLFIDLSGYTPLTEALMRHQKDGAEELAEALRTVFTPLIDQVYARGGLIPLFAGDGFTAIFRCPDEISDESAEQKPSSSPARMQQFPRAAVQVALQAAECALAIQRWLLGAGGVVQTKYGDFSMAATAGLSFGRVQWGIPGRGDNRTFYFRGEAVDECALAENQASDGEILANGSIVSLLRIQYRFEKHKTGMWSLQRRRTTPLSLHSLIKPRSSPATTASSSASASQDAVQRYAPFISEEIRSLAVKAEFREVCILFLSFQEPAEPSEMHDFLAEVMTLTSQFGGYINQLDFGDMGGYILLFFGAPVAHENDVERAAELLLLLRRQAWSLPWRAGIDYGTVWTGLRGGGERTEYGAAGNVVNMACRLFRNAPWHEIWISHSVARLLESQYVLDSLGDIPIKGRTVVHPVFRLLKSQPDITQTSLYPVGIIERTNELKQLNEWGAPLVSGQSPGLFLLYGEAGIGKSRLVREWRRHFEAELPVLWLLVPGDSTVQRPLSPLRHAMQRYFAEKVEQPLTRDLQYNRRLFEYMEDTLIEELASLGSSVHEAITDLSRGSSFLASLLDIYWEGSLYGQVEPRLRFDNLISAFKALIVAESHQQPIVLQLEDLHLYDEESLQFMRSLMHNVSDYPIGLVGTSRSREDGSLLASLSADSLDVREISLSSLSRDGVRHYASQVIQGEISESVVSYLMQKTNGNPFFVEQFALAMLEQGAIRLTRSSDLIDPLTSQASASPTCYDLVRHPSTPIPATLSAVMIARMDQLEPSVKSVVQTAAVIGPQFEISVLSRMIPDEPDLFQLVRKAQLAHVWKPSNDGKRYQFQHVLLREAAYEMQLRSQLRQIHYQAAVAMQQQHMGNLKPYYGSLAAHYDKADRLKSAAHWYTLAGEEAIKDYANADAITYISRGLALTEPQQHEERIKLLRLRASVYDILGNRAKQEQDIHALLNLAQEREDFALLAELTVDIGNYARVTNDYEKALDLFRDAIGQAIIQQNEHIETLGRYGMGRTLWQKGNYAEARKHLQLVRSLAEQSGDAERQGQSLYDLGIIQYYLEDYDAALADFQHAYSLFSQHGYNQKEGSCLAMFGVVHKQKGDYLAALDYYQQALTIYQSIGYRHGQAFVLGYLGNNYFELGYYQQAAAYHKQALHQCRELADKEGQAVSLNTLGLIALFNAQYGSARSQIEEALTIQRAIGHLRGEGYSLTYLGYTDTALKVHDSARVAHLEAIQLRERLSAHALIVDNWAGLAEIALAQANLEEALGHVQNILSWLDDNGPDGVEFPIQAYFTCFRVYREASKLDLAYLPLAQDALDQGEALLRKRAEAILDNELRRSFYGSVPANRAIQEAVKQLSDSGRAVQI